ncbi:hypothetical protein WMF11_19505 [Sorangium sp. So ce295]|uniref:hypothetical protein n=1 Tax=Sorangium sp. So ce295 TaxID=3133295 RepID=UPI003F628C77
MDQAGLMRVGTSVGYGELTVAGAHGTVVTEDTEIRSVLGGDLLRANYEKGARPLREDVEPFAATSREAPASRTGADR